MGQYSLGEKDDSNYEEAKADIEQLSMIAYLFDIDILIEVESFF